MPADCLFSLRVGTLLKAGRRRIGTIVERMITGMYTFGRRRQENIV